MTTQSYAGNIATKPTQVILVTGHPASGKTTLANILAQQLHLPLICRDTIKETLLDHLGWSSIEWTRKLSMVSWTLFYQQATILLQASIDHILESNFDPLYANPRWQGLLQQYTLRLIQVRCETEAEILLQRYRARVESGERHPGHVDQSEDQAFQVLISQGPMAWIDVQSERLPVDTSHLRIADYTTVAAQIKELLGRKGEK